MDPALEGGREEPGRDVLIALFGDPVGIDPHRVLEHRRLDLVVIDDIQVVGCVELTCVGIRRLEHLGVLVVDHGLGGIDLVVEQGIHGEILCHQLDIRDLVLGDRGEKLEFVAEAPVAHLLPCPVGRLLDPGIGPGNLERSRTLEHLGDVDDVGATLTGNQRLGHPGETELCTTGGKHLLWHDLNRTLDDLDVEALRLVETVVEGDVVAGELRLGEPLQLQPDRVGFGAILGGCGCPASLATGLAAVTTGGQDDRQPRTATGRGGAICSYSSNFLHS